MTRLIHKAGWTFSLYLLLSTTAWSAEQLSKQVDITLELTATCVLNVDDVQGFGSWPTGDENITQVSLGAVSVICADGMPYGVGMSAGEHFDGGSRRLYNGTNYVSYVLRAHSSSGQEWGDTGFADLGSDYNSTHPARGVFGTGNGRSQNITLWGDATISDASGGAYQDQISVILVW